ncbi:MAG: aspartate--tRNA ligase [Chloroflexi bacterium]|nr:aspartate--tRNA ligase [Chloroflexota bacterium]MDP6425577.1 aspartate--tRNA ligase [Dehalococcoidia bacterium]MDP7231584.1 aspartate--tRNA ligase [Dehalococcoidia bacterium]
MYKDVNNGELRKGDVGKSITVAGWVSRRRDHGNLIFIDLRDRSGLLQVVFNPKISSSAHKNAQMLRGEWVIQVSGDVVQRIKGSENPDLPTGDIELSADKLVVISRSKTPPFEVDDDLNIDDLTRLKYRFIDLRRPKMQALLKLRHDVTRTIWNYLSNQGFIQVETPILIKSTPEGARDYLVPSRLHKGQFYALPQSPQQLKQMLMVSGVERYFQIAHCFRDEDLRADRQPEHTQLDLEMSFVHQEDVVNLVEALFSTIVKEVRPTNSLSEPFIRISYDEAMERFGTDKPDVRFGLELNSITDIVSNLGINVFNKTLESGGTIRSLVLPGCGYFVRKQTDELIELAKSNGGKGLVFISIDNEINSIEKLSYENYRSPIKKLLSVEAVKSISNVTNAKPGDLIVIVADDYKVANNVLSNLRTEMGKRLKLYDTSEFSFVWVDNFPLFEWDDKESAWSAMHHVFSAPKQEDLEYLETDPGKVRAELYDLVCNGHEIGSGSIRIHDRRTQTRVFNVIGYTKKDIDERFRHLLDAFDYGAPPHGGMGLGLDRLIMILGGEDNIREVIAFPKTQAASDPLFDAPSFLGKSQIDELGILFKPTD